MSLLDIFFTPLFGLDLIQYLAILMIFIIAVKWVIPPIINFIALVIQGSKHAPHEESYLDEHPMAEMRGSSGFQLAKIIAVIVIISVGVILVNEVIPINAMMGSDPRLFPNTDQKEMIEFCENKLWLFQSEWEIDDPEMFMTACVNGGAEDTEFFRSYIPEKELVIVDVTNGTAP